MIVPRAKRALVAVVALLLSLSSARAYYHFVHYTGRTSPFSPIQEKFDLSRLPNKTVVFFVSDMGPSQFLQNDSFPSVLSQIRTAARVWNAVDTSDLRVAFGGLYTKGTPQSTPAGEIVFEELPPGVRGFGGPTATAEITNGPNGPFVPILRAIIRLNKDLTLQPGPSYSEGFLLTVVHEMGHALGLQHTLTSSAMATNTTRATSRARPIDEDDMAGLSLLYPNAKFAASTGSIAGRVTSGGQGVHLASVVALRQSGPAVSALSNPDGTYRIEGLAPGEYFVYVRPLPPATDTDLGPAEILLPIDPDGNAVPAGAPFGTIFYPSGRSPSQATSLTVNAAATVDSVNFAVQRRDSEAIYAVTTYSFIDQNAIRPGYLNTAPGTGTLVAAGAGLTVNGNPAPGLNVQVVGDSARLVPGSLRAYGSPYSYLALDVQFSLFAGTGARHLVFSLPEDVYVQPSALYLVQRKPPSINSITQTGSGLVTVTGSNLAADSRIFFDGLPAATRSFEESSGTAVVSPPPGASNQTASVSVFNSDGQNSFFTQPQPPVYHYENSGPPSATFSPNALPAGAEALIDISGVNTRFIEGDTFIGLGSSDVYVRRVWVLSPTRVLANVSVSPAAAQTTSLAGVISGFRVAAQPSGFHILPPRPHAPVVHPQLVNTAEGQTGIYSGAIVTLYGSNLSSGANASITLNDIPARLLYTSPTQINLVVPPGLSLGPAILRLSNGAENSYPVVIAIDPPPPIITGVKTSGGDRVDANRPARSGDVLSVSVTGLADPGTQLSVTRLRLKLNGIDHTATAVLSDASSVQVQFVVSNSVPASSQASLTVSMDARTSLPYYIPVK